MSAHTFGDSFTPLTWTGPRARQFSEPEDAFQQLVGDAFREAFPDSATVAPTRGRDGSADIWIGSVVEPPSRFQRFLYPFIVECKHHDSASAGLSGNILQGWANVAKRLKENCEAGWPGDYAHWKNAHAYLYCISARFRVASEREVLEKRIREFFGSLPASHRPPIAPTQIRVWDWGQLSAWFRESGRIRDEWLGVEWPDLIDHVTFRNRIGQTSAGKLQSFRGYLLEENLPFIAPNSADPTHPNRLFERLIDGTNLILIGEGGIGKTRLTFEIAELAVHAQWRVLHLNPSERSLDISRLGGELLRHSGKSLLVIDYIDQFSQFDVRFWHSSFLPEMIARGVQVSMLSNARVGAWPSLETLENSGVFATVQIQVPAERRQRISNEIEDRICQSAIRILGRERVRELCGQRPIVAMFIARELERAAAVGLLSVESSNAIRSGELVDWVNRRLREEGLIAEAEIRPWDSAPLSAGLCAASAVLAAGPMTEIEIVGVAAATLAKRGEKNEQIAARVVGALQSAGWLEPGERAELRTPHDTVADEVFLRVMHSDQSALQDLFASAVNGRPLGRFAILLRRILTGAESEKNRSIALAASEWLRLNAKELGAHLVAGQSDTTAYALGAIFECPVWTEVVIASWGELIQPWLDAHVLEHGARHLLHRGLRRLAMPDRTRLLQPAQSWLGLYGTAADANFILGPLLVLPPEQLGDMQPTLLAQSQRWLRAHGQTRDAIYVFRPLLRGWSSDRLGEYAEELFNTTIEWLTKYADEFEAGMIIRALLDRPERSRKEINEIALQLTWRWIDKHGQREEAYSIFCSLLARGTNVTAKGKVLSHTQLWLETHGESEAAKFVLTALLEWSPSEFGASQAEILEYAFKWLNVRSHTVDAIPILRRLLRWQADELRKGQRQLLRLIDEWTTIYAETPEAGLLLAEVVSWKQDRIGKFFPPMSEKFQRWMYWISNLQLSEYVISEILLLPGLSAESRMKLATMAIEKAPEHWAAGGGTQILKALLQVAGRFEIEVPAHQIVKCAGVWLDRHQDHPERRFVMARLLRIIWLPSAAWSGVASAALKSLELGPLTRSDDYLLNGMLTRIGMLSSADRNRCLDLCERWLQISKNEADAKAMLLYINRCISERELPISISSRFDTVYRTAFPSEKRFRWSHANELGGQ